MSDAQHCAELLPSDHRTIDSLRRGQASGLEQVFASKKDPTEQHIRHAFVRLCVVVPSQGKGGVLKARRKRIQERVSARAESMF